VKDSICSNRNGLIGRTANAATRNFDPVQIGDKSVVIIDAQDQIGNVVGIDDDELFPEKHRSVCGTIIQKLGELGETGAETRATGGPCLVVKVDRRPLVRGSRLGHAFEVAPGIAHPNETDVRSSERLQKKCEQEEPSGQGHAGF
jgi:hypothetical protein